MKQILSGEKIDEKQLRIWKENYVIKHNRIYRKTEQGERLLIPKMVRGRVIKMGHDDNGHTGITRSLEFLKRYVWFPSMKHIITKYIKSCPECLYNQRGIDENRYILHVPTKEPIPFYTVHLDYLGPFPKSSKGNMYILGMVDAFTKFIIIRATKNTNSRNIVKLMTESMQYFGSPTRIITDRGSAFTAKELKKFCEENVIQHTLTAVHTPRANGQIERYFRTTEHLLLV